MLPFGKLFSYKNNSPIYKERFFEAILELKHCSINRTTAILLETTFSQRYFFRVIVKKNKHRLFSSRNDCLQGLPARSHPDTFTPTKQFFTGLKRPKPEILK